VAAKRPDVWLVKVPTSCLSGSEAGDGDGCRCRSHRRSPPRGLHCCQRGSSWIATAYREVGNYRGAAAMCGVTHKTVSRVVNRAKAAEKRTARRRNYESVRALVATKIEQTSGKISEAAAARRQGRGLCGLGPQLPASGRAGTQRLPAATGEGAIAPPGGVVAG